MIATNCFPPSGRFIDDGEEDDKVLSRATDPTRASPCLAAG